MKPAWYLKPAEDLDHDALQVAQTRQNALTKPPGSLGELEEIALKFAAWQGCEKPKCDDILIRVFAADHGVCKQNVSAFPQSVTAQMILNFVNGGAAISVLARQLQADFKVINMGTCSPIEEEHETLVNHQLMPGTDDFTQQPAMPVDILEAALNAGRQEVINNHAHLFIAGEMGIGNTTSASAIYSLLLKTGPEATVGPGTGVDKTGLANKRKAIYQAFNLHSEHLDSAIGILQHVGGLEVAALVGAYIAAAQQGLPILVDGFITTAAALLAVRINPTVRNWMIFAHQSAEPAHQKALESLGAKPLLSLSMRLGEGSGAAVAAPLIQSALALHTEMATFTEAQVNNANH